MGPSVETSLLLLTYAFGAATSLGAGMLFGRKLLARVRQSSQWSDGLRRGLGAAVVLAAATIWLGADTGLLTRLSSTGTTILERGLIATVGNASETGMARTAGTAAAGRCAISAAARAVARTAVAEH